MAPEVSGNFYTHNMLADQNNDNLISGDELQSHLDAGKPFTFNFNGQDITLKKGEDGNYQALDAEGNVIDDDVEIKTSKTVDGYIEITPSGENTIEGLEEGESLFIGGTTATTLRVGSTENDSNVTTSEFESNSKEVARFTNPYTPNLDNPDPNVPSYQDELDAFVEIMKELFGEDFDASAFVSLMGPHLDALVADGMDAENMLTTLMMMINEIGANTKDSAIKRLAAEQAKIDGNTSEQIQKWLELEPPNEKKGLFGKIFGWIAAAIMAIVAVVTTVASGGLAGPAAFMLVAAALSMVMMTEAGGKLIEGLAKGIQTVFNATIGQMFDIQMSDKVAEIIATVLITVAIVVMGMGGPGPALNALKGLSNSLMNMAKSLAGMTDDLAKAGAQAGTQGGQATVQMLDEIPKLMDELSQAVQAGNMKQVAEIVQKFGTFLQNTFELVSAGLDISVAVDSYRAGKTQSELQDLMAALQFLQFIVDQLVEFVQSIQEGESNMNQIFADILEGYAAGERAVTANGGGTPV